MLFFLIFRRVYPRIFFKGLCEKGHIVKAALYRRFVYGGALSYKLLCSVTAIVVYILNHRLPRNSLKASRKGKFIGKGQLGKSFEGKLFIVVFAYVADSLFDNRESFILTV